MKKLKSNKLQKQEKIILTEKERIKAIKLAEKGKKIEWKDAEKIIDSWK